MVIKHHERKLIMAIKFIEDKKIFRLDAGTSTYVMQVRENGYLQHLYYGASVKDDDLEYMITYLMAPFHPKAYDSYNNKAFSTDIQPMEYPVNGTGDFRTSAFSANSVCGSNASELKYESYRIIDGKPGLEGLPATYLNEGDKAQTLEITMIDQFSGVKVKLYYTAFESLNVITRHSIVENCGKEPVFINRVMSTCLDFNRVEDYDIIHLWGKWAKERQLERIRAPHGITNISSKRGSSSHYHNPFIALCDHTATEDSGDVYGVNLVYSGNFAAEVEVQAEESMRLIMGINPIDFSWKLEAGESFTSPEAVMVFSKNGIGEMSRNFHKLYNRNLCRGYWKDNKRPILINNWEATYFDFDDDKLETIAKGASELGIEMLVMDDGWFTNRLGEFGGLGDWEVNTEKLKEGLSGLCKRINALGMKFGIWFEPEMVASNTKLYAEHPDWILHVGDRTRNLDRNQMVLDLSRKDVQDYLFGRISDILDNANISYIKWDFNRNLTEAGSALLPKDRQLEVFHRYVLGLYALLERLHNAYPMLLLEGCSGGGGRFDPAMLYYSPQIWTSDNTDALDRCKIQYGSSLCYPASMTSAHVSASPCHQTHRASSFATRGNVAMAGSFGYELDLNLLCDEEKELVKKQVQQYHDFYNCIHYGDYYRLVSPFENEYCAWNFVSENKDEAILVFVVMRDRIFPRYFVKLKGLDPNKKYKDVNSGKEYYGDTLMNCGLNLTKIYGDLGSTIVHLKEVK